MESDLRRQLLWTRVLALGALGLAVAALATRPQSRPADLVARSLVLEGGGLTVADAAGRPKAALLVGPDGSPRLSLAGSSGQALLEAEVYGDAPRLSLKGPEGKEFFSLSLQVDGSSRLELADREGRPRVILGAGETGAPELVLVDRAGRPRAQLRINDADAPRLFLEGKDGDVFQAPLDEGPARAN